MRPVVELVRNPCFQLVNQSHGNCNSSISSSSSSNSSNIVDTSTSTGINIMVEFVVPQKFTAMTI